MEVFSSRPSAPELHMSVFDLPSDDPVQIRNIDGLGPVKAELSSTPFASGDGELYQGASVGKRNIVLTLGLNPNWADQSMATLRQILYAYFMPKAWCKLRFFSDHMSTVDIEGVVESCDPNLFSQDPEMQVSVICHKPDFIDADALVLEGIVDDILLPATEHVFEYPEHAVPTGIELRIDRTVANVAYTGPIVVTLTAQGMVPQVFSVGEATVDNVRSFKLSTVKTRKKVSSVLISDSSVTNLLYQVTEDSKWPMIEPGENVLTVQANEPDQAWTLAYFKRFGGL